MENTVDSYGHFAGKIWQSLISFGPQTKKKIIENTGLNDNEFCFGVGWLAKENKISKDKMKYQLGETNLTSKIGYDAGMVWKILDMWGEVNLDSISRLAHIKEEDVFSAVGWLACEDKIGGMKMSQWMLMLMALLMLIPIVMLILSLTIPYPLIKWVTIIASVFLLLFNIVGLPGYPGWYDRFLIVVGLVFNAVIVWFAWTW